MEKILSSHWNALAHQAWNIKKQRAALEKQEKELFQQLKIDLPTDTYTSKDFTFKASERKGNVVYSQIEILKTINLELYRGTSIVSWKLEKN